MVWTGVSFRERVKGDEVRLRDIGLIVWMFRSGYGGWRYEGRGRHDRFGQAVERNERALGRADIRVLLIIGICNIDELNIVEFP